MSEWSLRLQTPTSQLTAQLPHVATVKVLREHVAALTGLDDPVLKCGFPPVLLDADDGASAFDAVGGRGARVLVSPSILQTLERAEAAAPEPKRQRSSGGASSRQSQLAELGIFVSGEDDRPDGWESMEEVDCRKWDTDTKTTGAITTLSFGEGKLADKRGGDAERNIRHLTHSANLIKAHRAKGRRCWVHCHQGINRGPAGAIAYLLLHTPVPTLAEACRIVRAARSKARSDEDRRPNTFLGELRTIAARNGKH